uniref:Uncharacterized protein n=1 Tax=Glossina austeni TaxID=7395 RepID=A0A1A9VKU8_GLOAU
MKFFLINNLVGKLEAVEVYVSGLVSIAFNVGTCTVLDDTVSWNEFLGIGFLLPFGQCVVYLTAQHLMTLRYALRKSLKSLAQLSGGGKIKGNKSLGPSYPLSLIIILQNRIIQSEDT